MTNADAGRGRLDFLGVNSRLTRRFDLRDVAPGTPVTMEAATVNVVNGYPAATATGIEVAANLGSIDGVTVTHNAGSKTTTIQVSGAATPANRQITYVESAAADTPPTISFNGSATNCG